MNRIPPATPFFSAARHNLDAAEAALERAFEETRRTPADLNEGGDRPQWAAAYAAADVAYASAYEARAIAREVARLLGV
jgi:hypothetical protein